MPRLDSLIPQKDPSESILVEFDFAGELTAPASAVVSIAALNGTDPAVGSMLDGSPVIVGTVVSQRVKLGVDKLNYKIRCEATQGVDVRVRAAILPVRTA